MHNILFRGDDITSNKKHVISCRVNDDEFNNIINVANQLKMKKSDILKLSLKDDLNKYRPINFTNREMCSLLKNRSRLLGKLGNLSSNASDLSRRWLLAGNNINQIAHRVNMSNVSTDSALRSDINNLNNKLVNNKLIKQNDLLVRRLTAIWQSLE